MKSFINDAYSRMVKRQRAIVDDTLAHYRDVGESEIQRVITDACDKAAIPYMRNYNSLVITAKDGKKQLARLPAHQKGKPDLTVLCLERLCLWIECKARHGVLSEDQQRWQNWIIDRGHEYHAPRTIDEAHAIAAIALKKGR